MNAVKDAIIFANEILGKEGPIILDTRVHWHNASLDVLKAHPHGLESDRLSIGFTGRKITMQDIYNAIIIIDERTDFRREFESGRAYDFGGFGSANPKMYYITWNS